MRIQRIFFLWAIIPAIFTVSCSSGTSTPPSNPNTNATAAASAVRPGGDHACVLTAAGGVQCWGDNQQGSLGDGTNTTHLIPVDVSGLASGVTQIASGRGFSCAVNGSGGVQCWGENSQGTLGDGTTTSRSTPVNVVGLNSGVTVLTAGFLHACAVAGGSLHCWGNNGLGQLGDGTNNNQTTPVAVTGLNRPVISACVGQSHTCVVTDDNRAKCFGDNSLGQAGNDTPNAFTVPAPADVADLNADIASVVCGDQHTCALTMGGGVKCWGANQFGQLGNGVTGNLSTPNPNPADVIGLTSGVTAVSSNASNQTCALTASGGVKCWGANGGGQLGNGTTANSNLAVDVTGLTSGVSAIGVGGISCAIPSAGGLKCWGGGAVGNDTGLGSTTPVDVTGF